MQAKWDVLCQRMRDAGVRQLGQIRLTPRMLSSRYYAKRAIIRETAHVYGDREVFAYCGIWRACNEYQVGPLYLRPEYNTPSMGKAILREVLDLVPDRRRAFMVVDQRSDAYDTAVIEESIRRLHEELGCCGLQVLLGKPH